jgi:ribosomal protein S18 acetylase RimI-like enzyme
VNFRTPEASEALVVREAAAEDAASVSRIAIETYEVAFGHSMSAADLYAQIRSELLPPSFAEAMGRDVILLAEMSRQLVGYVQFGPARSLESFGADRELRRLYVRASHQDKGIGSRLMRAALEHPALANARAAALDVWVQNSRAQQFYRRFGFERVALREFRVASGAATTPDVVMIRRLAGSPVDIPER